MTKGQIIGHYNILRPLGKGGMGEVYLAEDIKLKREVALKVLPESVRNDPERLRRFRTEAEAAAKLNHPNIATIHSIEEAEGQTFITMEYVDGETLQIPDGGLDTDQFFDWFLPLADALSHAHGHGRIHRDLKPANIMIREDGTPKILDFGLARIEREGTEVVDSEAPTMTMDGAVPPSLTQGKGFMGTPSYMSPEQIEGKQVDVRTDLFSFGIVMYEALTGQRPFKGENVESIIGRILTEEPKSVTELKPITPYTLWSVVRKCLMKACGRRMQTAEELHSDLLVIQQDARDGTMLVDASTIPEPVPEPVGPEPVPLWRQPQAIATIVLVGIVTAMIAWNIKPAPERPLRKFQLPMVESNTYFINGPVISPDGRMIAYIQQSRIWVRDLVTLDNREIPDSDGAYSLFWSPDSKIIGYAVKNSLWTVPTIGGSSIKICDAISPVHYATWGEDDLIVFGQRGAGIMKVPAQGGNPVTFQLPDTTRGEVDINDPYFLPDGRTLLFNTGIRDGGGEILLQNGARRTTLLSSPTEGLWSPQYAPSGHILYHKAYLNEGGRREIWAVPFSLSSLTVAGEPFLVTREGVFPSVSSDGTLVYRSLPGGNIGQLALVDRAGRVTKTIGQPQAEIMVPALSPDGQMVAVGGGGVGNQDIWVYDIVRGTRIPLIIEGGFVYGPAWSPDGTEVAFSIFGDGTNDIFKRRADGSGSIESLVTGPEANENPHWSRDGRFLVFQRSEKGQADIWMTALDSSGTPVQFTDTPYSERLPVLSPDGRYVAYVSSQSGSNEVYVKPFPSGTGQWLVGPGYRPKWKGTELFYVSGDNIMVMDVSTGGVFQPGISKALFSADEVGADINLGPRFNYDVSADGQRFVVVQRIDKEKEATITVVQNWSTEFKDRK